VAELDAGKYDDAIKVLNDACAANPNDAIMFLNRGFAFNELKRYKEGLSDLSRSITLDPKKADAYFNRALSYQKLGQPDLANQDIEKGKELKAKAKKSP
jgi:tetratricopeptide (TPR) repeat protein